LGRVGRTEDSETRQGSKFVLRWSIKTTVGGSKDTKKGILRELIYSGPKERRKVSNGKKGENGPPARGSEFLKIRGKENLH